MTEKKNKIPSVVQVGPFKYSIEFIENITEKLRSLSSQEEEQQHSTGMVYGCLSPKDQTIFLANGHKEDVIADTLLHEILHAIWALVGGWAYSEADEERIVSMLTGTLLDTLRRNRELTRFLFEND